MIFDMIQLIAGLIFCYSYIPQIMEIYKNKSAKDVSLTMYVLCIIGSILSEVYIFYLMVSFAGAGWMMLITNTIGLILSSITVYLIKKYRE
jgi:MtN3 and saliva related transmembrane protein